MKSKAILKALVPAQVRPAAKHVFYDVHYRLWAAATSLAGAREEPRLREPIFMIGCPRSGTTISVDLFGRHPWVANWSEAGRVWDPAGYDDAGAEHWWGAEMVTEEARRRLHGRFEWYRQRLGKRRFVNKHPRNSVRIDYIRAIFPDALFIHVIRDGRAVVNSIVKRIERDRERQHVPFGDFCKPPQWRRFVREDPIEQAALQWREITSSILGKRSELGDRYYEFKYEDLCLRPREVLAGAFAFAGLPADDALLGLMPEHLKNMNYKVEQELAPAQIGTINRVQRELLEMLGYERVVGSK